MSKRVAVDAAANTDHGAPIKRRQLVPVEEDQSRDLLSVLDLVFDTGVFALSDLQALMNTSHAVSGFLRESRVWKPLYLDDKVIVPSPTLNIASRIHPLGLAPPYGRISKEDWYGPHIPNEYSVRNLHLPPRRRARTQERPDHSSYYPERNDVRAKGFVLAGETATMHHFNPETGALEDLFYPANEDAGPASGMFTHRTKVYIPRDLPIVCNACGGVVCTSYAALVEHCLTLEHQKATVPSERRIPKEFEDPRNLQGYANMTPFEQVKMCLVYKHKVLDCLRASPDDAGIQTMEHALEWVTERAEEIGFSTEHCTLERVIKAHVDFVVREFELSGMGVHGSCRDVILGGWGNFSLDMSRSVVICLAVLES